jgi:NDP-sugar pyrophosphorylase family protein
MGFQDIIVAMKANNSLRSYLEKEFQSKLKLEIVETEELIHNIDVLEYLSDRIVKNFLIVPCDLVSNLELDDIL